ncbi:protein NYNRIN-like [Cucumis melo var. makuwa]|uniref:Protein NYNRIN-like n=1 Tax=Cucumis melo var. makuwa TaxID=1194695 RepID=A0A5D3BXF1_CUCMM|nr:protein NYNRIN-like [Cucumis melo var. makuwa]TYK03744.1 protein NYNRIN-like [Cucumis melo var. makuwa]
MVQDSNYAKNCEACQYHANFIHQPQEPLHPTVASWSFEAWGLDPVGPITPKSSAGHSYILAATDYFSKWAEAIPLREAKKENVANFIRTLIVYRYCIPHQIMTDNGRQFSNSMIDKLCEKIKFKQYKSSMYNAVANSLAEAFNKNVMQSFEENCLQVEEGLAKSVKHCGLIEPPIALLQRLHHTRLFMV